MRPLDEPEAADRMRWLSGDDWPAVYGSGPGATGYDPRDGWLAAVWLLHAMYERPDLTMGLTHQELHQQAVGAGLREPTVVAGLDLDEVTTATGQTLGFQQKPGPEWLRRSWSELGRRDGFDFWAVSGQGPDRCYTPQSAWPNPAVMPADSFPEIRPIGASSWPVSILPPPEGSLDEESLQALTEVLAHHTAPDVLGDCGAYYGPVAFMREGATVYVGHLHDLLALVRSVRNTGLTPNNIWPADRSWLVYTNYDLWATRVSGSAELIEALCADDQLDTVRCGGYPAG